MGVQTRTCNTTTGQWSAWGACSISDACECTDPQPASSQTCNGCGTQTRTVTCNTATGQWDTGAWSECDKEISDCEECPEGFERNEFGICEASCLDWCGVSPRPTYNSPSCYTLNDELNKLYPGYEAAGFEMVTRGWTAAATYREGDDPREKCAKCNTQYRSPCLAMYSVSADGKWTKIRDASSIANHPTCSCPLCPNGAKAVNKQHPNGGTVATCEEDCPPGEERDPNNGNRCRKVYKFVPVKKNVLVGWRFAGNPSSSSAGLTYGQSVITYYEGGSPSGPNGNNCTVEVVNFQNSHSAGHLGLDGKCKGNGYASGQEIMCTRCSKYSATCGESCLANDGGLFNTPLDIRKGCSSCVGLSFSSADGQCAVGKVVQGEAYFCEAQEQ